MLNIHTYIQIQRYTYVLYIECVTTIFFGHHWPVSNTITRYHMRAAHTLHMWSLLHACNMFNQNQIVFMGIQVCIKCVILHVSHRSYPFFFFFFSFLPWHSFNQIDWQPYALSQNRVLLNAREIRGQIESPKFIQLDLYWNKLSTHLNRQWNKSIARKTQKNSIFFLNIVENTREYFICFTIYTHYMRYGYHTL